MNLRTRQRPVAVDDGWFIHLLIVAVTLAGLTWAWSEHDERLVALAAAVVECRTEAHAAWDHAVDVEQEAAERISLIRAACVSETVRCQYAMERSPGSGRLKDRVAVHCSRPGGCGVSVNWASEPLAWTIRKP